MTPEQKKKLSAAVNNNTTVGMIFKAFGIGQNKHKKNP
jgi:hypothetical protein